MSYDNKTKDVHVAATATVCRKLRGVRVCSISPYYKLYYRYCEQRMGSPVGPVARQRGSEKTGFRKHLQNQGSL